MLECQQADQIARRLQLRTPLMLSVHLTQSSSSHCHSMKTVSGDDFRLICEIRPIDIGIVVGEGCSLDKLLQFRSDRFRGGWGKIAPVVQLVDRCRARSACENIAARDLVGKLPRCYWVSPWWCGRWLDIPRKHRNPSSLTRPYPSRLCNIAMTKVRRGWPTRLSTIYVYLVPC